MNIGVPKERRPSEYRVGLSPAGVGLLVENGHTCYIESQAGLGSGFSDEEFREAGGQIVYTGEEAYGRAELVLKAARPTDQELAWFVPGQALAGLLHLAAARPNKVEALLRNEITALAYDQIQRDDGVLPVLKPLSQIGGKMAVHLAAQLLQNSSGGKGVLLGGVAGVPSAEVIIVGGGVVGETAAKAFIALGAQVTVLDKSLERLQILDKQLGGRLVTLVSHPFNLARACSYADVVIGAVHIPGERAPLVITRKLIKKMRKGAIFLDLSIDEGGCSETSRPTSHQEPTYMEEGILHCCIPNLPGVVARTATHAFLNAAWPYIQAIANLGVEAALENNPALARGIATHAGKLRMEK
jgi:alanine dehydrogenase